MAAGQARRAKDVAALVRAALAQVEDRVRGVGSHQIREGFGREGREHASVVLHQLAEREPEVPAYRGQVWMDGQRAAEHVDGLLVLRECKMAEPLTGERPEVIGVAREGFA